MTAQTLLLALAMPFLAAGLRPIIDGDFRRWLGWASIATAAFLVLVAIVWDLLPAPAAGSLRAGFESVAADVRWWIWLGLAVLAAQFVMNALTEIRRNNEIKALRNDVQSIAAVINRAVMPRHLTKSQQATIAGFLTRVSPHRLVVQAIARDQEAHSFANDFREAFSRGGWTVTIVQVDNSQEGLRCDFRQTTAHQQVAEDPKDPKADQLLKMALGLAGIRLDGSGGGSGVNQTEDMLTLSIGRHRMDTYTVDPPLWGPGM